ncbi:hypothetical protein KR009_011897 [Drosophila setifemur]|nr:hypothetical protein KR009_011897 [Drosophila setifemur]
MILSYAIFVVFFTIPVRSEIPERTLNVNVPTWDVNDLYTRFLKAFNSASSTEKPQSTYLSWDDYYNAILQKYYNKKHGEQVPVNPLPLPIPIPMPLPRPPRPNRPLRPLRPPRPNRPRPKPTRKPTRKSTTTRKPTTTTTKQTTTQSTTTTTKTTVSPSTTTSIPTTTDATNSTTIAPTTNSTTEETSTTGGSSTTGIFPTGSSTSGGSSTTGIFPTGSSTTEIVVVSSFSKPLHNAPKSHSETQNTSKPHVGEMQSNLFQTPTVLSLHGLPTNSLRPEQQLTVESPPQSMTTMCYNYPRLCAQPEQAQYVRLIDGFGKPMLLILPGGVPELPRITTTTQRPMSWKPRPGGFQPVRRRQPSRNKYVYRLMKKRNNQRF